MRKHCLIASATTNKMITSGLAHFLMDAKEKNHRDEPWAYSTVVFENQKSYAIFRNHAVQSAMEIGADRLWFFDNDVVPGENVWDLMELDADVAGAVVATFHSMSAVYRKDGEPWGDGKRSGVLDVTGMGMACTWIDRKVFSDLRMRYEYDGDPPAVFQFQYQPNGAVRMGEDFDFCQRASALGYRVRLNTNIECGHVKTVDLRDAIRVAQERVAA